MTDEPMSKSRMRRMALQQPDAKAVLEKYAVMEFNIRNSTRPEVSAAELALIETRDALAASEAEAQVLRTRVEALEQAMRANLSMSVIRRLEAQGVLPMHARRFPMTDLLQGAKRDAKTVLEKHAVWRDETLQVSGPYQIAHPSREVELYDALAASEARAQVLRARVEALEQSNDTLRRIAMLHVTDYTIFVVILVGVMALAWYLR